MGTPWNPCYNKGSDPAGLGGGGEFIFPARPYDTAAAGWGPYFETIWQGTLLHAF